MVFDDGPPFLTLSLVSMISEPPPLPQLVELTDGWVFSPIEFVFGYLFCAAP